MGSTPNHAPITAGSLPPVLVKDAAFGFSMASRTLGLVLRVNPDPV
jgi:hypothetical protein